MEKLNTCISKFTHILRIKKQLPSYNKQTHVITDAILSVLSVVGIIHGDISQ